MKAQANRQGDKRFLTEVAERMNISKSRIRLDECGDWNIFGRNGHLYTDGLGVLYFYYSPGTVGKWNNFKRRFSFMDKYVDGDDEGILEMFRLPTEKEGEMIRKTLKLRISFQPKNSIENTQKFTSDSPSTGGV